MATYYKHIELFAGCGGLSLGLEKAGFKLMMANELSPMASETFALNLLGEDLLAMAEKKIASKKVLWIKSQYKRNNLRERLRENPFEFSKGKYCDIDSRTDFKGKLIIGNIDDFLTTLTKDKALLGKIRNLNIDLLSGGPPCQGFSLAGKRIKDDQKNLLPLSFARFAGLLKPKVVLLENVQGITAPFTDNGIKHFAWIEVAKAFALQGFCPVCMLLNSKYFAVPQNRPRFILIAFRKDIFKQIHSLNGSKEAQLILNNSSEFVNKVNKFKKDLNSIKTSDLSLYNIEAFPDLFNGYLLPKLITGQNSLVKVFDAIDDISETSIKYQLDQLKSPFTLRLSSIFDFGKFPEKSLMNHEYRKHNFNVRARFRLYQVFSYSNGLKHELSKLLSGKEILPENLEKIFNTLKKENLLFQDKKNEVLRKPQNLEVIKDYLKQIGSKKQSQRALRMDEPAPAQLTIPDDLCHYSPNQIRTLTVREMARIQSFPDWFEFRSKVTTGGKQRKFEVPQYTQVGNAVPPLLAHELGKTIFGLLQLIKNGQQKANQRG
jgi:DNA (cytosine-5)-methyltransferase 1